MCAPVVFKGSCALDTSVSASELERNADPKLHAWSDWTNLPLSEDDFPNMSVRARNVLFCGLKIKTIGEFFALDADAILATRNAGSKTCREILCLRGRMLACEPEKWQAEMAKDLKLEDACPVSKSVIPSEEIKACESCLQLPFLEEDFPSLSVRTSNILFRKLKIKTFGEFFALDSEAVLAVRNAGSKTCCELLELRGKLLADGPEKWKTEPAKLKSAEDQIPRALYGMLSARSQNTLKKIFRHRPTLDELRGLTLEKIKAIRGAGKKVCSELMGLRRKFISDTEIVVQSESLSAASYGSFHEMILKTVESFTKVGPIQLKVLDQYMGLLGSSSVATLDVTGKALGVTRERVRQVAKKISERVFISPPIKPFSDVVDYVREMFKAKDWRLPAAELETGLGAAFGWKDVSSFNVCRLMAYHGYAIVELPEGQGLGLNERGRFDWVSTWKPMAMSEKRHLAIKTVLQHAGYAGMTIEEIVWSCHEKFPDANVEVGNVRGAMNGTLDKEGTKIIAYERGMKAATKYSLNTFFRDEQTVAVLSAAAKEIRAYMENTGLGIVSIWKFFRKYKDLLPRPLPKIGFYMMLRDLNVGGLLYSYYPRITYPGIKTCQDVYWWILFEYCMLCGRTKVTFAEVMKFFVDSLGLQPTIAASCAFASMGLKKVEDEFQAPYLIQRPSEKIKPPSVFLPSITNYRDFSLAKPPASSLVNPYYLDEDGKALTHVTYVKLFFLKLQENGFSFPAAELSGLLDKGWCKKHLKSYHPVLLPTHGKQLPDRSGYLRIKFTFGGEDYFISNDWEPRNKPQFDNWASRIASLAGIDFSPYEIKGLQKYNDSESE